LKQDQTSEREIDHGHAEYTVEELLEQSQGNAASLLLATLSVLAERGITVDAWAAGVARVFARSWERDEPWSAAEFLDALLTNLRSLGATVAAVDLGAPEPSATIRDYPDDDLADALGVDVAFGEAMFHAGAHLADRLGLDLHWQREDDRVALRVSVPGADA
jgi:hypothetical protein